MTPEPLALALSWVAGTSMAAALLAWWRVGGAGIRLLLAVVVATGLAAVSLTGGPGGTLAVGAAGIAVVFVTLRTPRLGVVGWAATGAANIFPATTYGLLPALGDAILLGSITAGLCLGHWFLVDPHLPRGPMRALAGGGLVGLAVSSVATLAAPTSLPAIGGRGGGRGVRCNHRRRSSRLALGARRAHLQRCPVCHRSLLCIDDERGGVRDRHVRTPGSLVFSRPAGYK